MKEKLLGSDDELVAVALRLLWDLDTFLADAAADRIGHLRASDRAALVAAIGAMRDALTTVRSRADPTREPKRAWPRF